MPLEDASNRPDLTEFEAMLGSLKPTEVIHRDRIVFRAGQASVNRRTNYQGQRFWPALAAGLAALAVGEGAMLAHRLPPEVVERIVVREPVSVEPKSAPTVEVAVESAPRSEPISLVVETSARNRLTDQILKRGLDAWAAPASAVKSIHRPPLLSGRALLRQEIRNILLVGDQS